MCKCNKYPNGQPQPVGLQQQSAIETELKKLWRELNYMNEQIEQLTQAVASMQSELDTMECYGMAGPPD